MKSMKALTFGEPWRPAPHRPRRASFDMDDLLLPPAASGCDDLEARQLFAALVPRTAMPDSTRDVQPSYQFGGFTLIPSQRRLLEGERPVRLGDRAFDILVALVGRAGELVPQHELIAEVWGKLYVEDANLRVHISNLRKVLSIDAEGARYIVNVAGQGYKFVAPVATGGNVTIAALGDAPSELLHNLPRALPRLVGRGAFAATIERQLSERRFVTIVGPGGIGKTAMALNVAEAQLRNYRDGIWLIDLAPLVDPDLVTSALARVLRMPIASADALTGVVLGLASKQMLLVLDNCEHVIDAAATLVEAILERAPEVSLLATSREPLRTAGERVARLLPLDVPMASPPLSAVEALTYPAVQLFVERASQSVESFALTDANAPIVADICRKLDGIPLAIELAAGQLEAFNPRAIADVLEDRFRLLMRGRRTALPRHQTLSATLDWSYDALSDAERVILRRLSVFAGGFELDDACAVVSSSELGKPEVTGHVANLFSKSLLSADASDEAVRYRLLDTTRAYAKEKLNATSEVVEFAHRHAVHYRAVFQRAEVEWSSRTASDWLSAYGGDIDNVRIALDWAFSPGGDAALGIGIAAPATSLWMRLSHYEECRVRVLQALENHGAALADQPADEMKLLIALGWSILLTNRGTAAEACAAASRATVLAEGLSHDDGELAAMWVDWLAESSRGGHRAAFGLAQRFHALAVAVGNEHYQLIGDRMIGFSLQHLGDQHGARRHIEHMLDHYVAPAFPSFVVRPDFDQEVLGRTVLAHAQWLLGYPDQATASAIRCLETAMASRHEPSIRSALAFASCPIALYCGEFAKAEGHADMLIERAARQRIILFEAYGRCYKGIASVGQGAISEGLRRFRDTFDQFHGVQFNRYLGFVAAMGDCFGQAGNAGQGLARITQGLALAESTGEKWCLAELQRVQGELHLRMGGVDSEHMAEAAFFSALETARSQGALSWELRAATSLARLMASREKPSRGALLLGEVLGRFTEGFDTKDLREARALVGSLSRSSLPPSP
ncbi:ATP-binding protein [Caulobacter sp. KR2-114]|uniref:ATP-binding protein n=1 Tax=Caulobacter sp. KR2-114 TaxID=3400912 RepID=UPI003C08C5D0